jgi:3-oxoacyl-[acyl-carrier protein] reductase
MPMSAGLEHKRILVTASSSGIGYAAAEAFLNEGSRVVINSSNGEKLETRWSM